MNWMMINTMQRLTEHTILRRHQLHRLINQQISKQHCEDLQKSLKDYLAEEEAKPSYMVIDHLAQELDPYKVTSSARSRRISSYVRGMLITVNVLMP